MRCWCGNERLTSFGAGYLRCDACQTLVSQAMQSPPDTAVRDDATDFYGRDYWFSHQTRTLNCPDIVSRSRTDLAERCVHWLRSLLEFKLPPARVLEVGAAHGGFVATMRQAGFEATGLELSPSIVQLARQTFDVTMLTGPVETQRLLAGTFDAVVLLDVMEHLPDPERTLGACLELLNEDGVLLLQTPAYPECQSLELLQATGHQFPEMLDPAEHLYLFSQHSAAAIFRQLKAPYIQFVPAIFGFYDMSFVVSRRPLRPIPIADREAALSATMNGRFMQAMLDLDARRLTLLGKYRELRDRTTTAGRRSA